MEAYSSSDDENYCYSDQDSLDGFDDEESDALLATSKCSSVTVITQESLLTAQRESVRQVVEMLAIREHHARTLLIHYRWDVVNLLAVYVEKGEALLFAEAGVTVVDSVDIVSLDTSSFIMCNVCMEDVSGSEVTKMDCGHDFCNICWTEHFIVKINEGQSKRIKCMAHKCNAICDEAIVRNLVSKKHPDLTEKFNRFLLESYIEDNKKVKWCPSTPHCGNAIRVDDDELCEVECSCSLQFCFHCLSEAHSPCSCLMWELWTKKCRDESETVNWITVHTKSCPKCHKPVEKNGGCNLVSCICGQAFCWLCGGATGQNHTWSSISGHSCGRYKEEEKMNSERAKTELCRYMHYHNRYKAHKDSFKLESKLNETVKEKVSILEQKYSAQRDFTWLTNGLYRLFRSRRILSYSYPFAFYMFGDDLFKDEMSKQVRETKKNLFEVQQQQFEENVEKLSKFIEEPIDERDVEKIFETRMEILNLSVIVDNLCKKMYECIESDLLGKLQFGTHNISPYLSKGIEKAAELSVCHYPTDNKAGKRPAHDDNTAGATTESNKLLVAGSSVDGGCKSRKRNKKGSERSEKSMIGLNLPSEVVDGNRS